MIGDPCGVALRRDEPGAVTLPAMRRLDGGFWPSGPSAPGTGASIVPGTEGTWTLSSLVTGAPAGRELVSEPISRAGHVHSSRYREGKLGGRLRPGRKRNFLSPRNTDPPRLERLCPQNPVRGLSGGLAVELSRSFPLYPNSGRSRLAHMRVSYFSRDGSALVQDSTFVDSLRRERNLVGSRDAVPPQLPANQSRL